MTGLSSIVREWATKARAEGWALGQFNIGFLEAMPAIVTAAERLLAPVIIGVSPRTIDLLGLNYLAATARIARQETTVPIMFHLDHGRDIATIEACINAGFDSVMIDGSMLPYDEHVALVKQVMRIAQPRNVTVEAQLGETWGERPGNERRTDPEQAQAFVTATCVDMLAVSIGTKPGNPDAGEELELSRLQAIANVLPGVPLVLHGGTGVTDTTLSQALAAGIAKVNIDTALRRAVSAVFVEWSHQGVPGDIRAPLDQAKKAITAAVEARLRAFGSEGRADRS